MSGMRLQDSAQSKVSKLHVIADITLHVAIALVNFGERHHPTLITLRTRGPCRACLTLHVYPRGSSPDDFSSTLAPFRSPAQQSPNM